jgi:hypothetical protein
MPTPSLVNIPFITAPSVLFSQIPESGAGDFVVTRVTSPTTNRSTRVNADGLLEFVNDNVPRLDYPLGGAVNGCASLLVEPSAQNLALQSENFGTTWTPVNLLAFGSGSVLNTTGTLDPFGGNSADLIVANTTPAVQHRVDQVTASASGSYTFSVFVKAAGYNFCRLRIGNTGGDFNLNTGVVTVTDAGIVTSIRPFGNGWYRCIISKAASAANETVRINMQPASNTGDFAGDGISGIYVFGAQYETGSVPTSYIPTTTAAITRNADVIRKTGITSLIGQSEGTVYFELEVTDEVRNRWFCSVDSAANSFIQMFITSTRLISVSILNGGSVVMANLTSSALSVGYHKIAFAYNTATNGCIMYIDGVQNPAATTRTVVAPGLPAFNNVSFGTYFSTTVDTLKAHVRAGAVYPNRISDLDLEFLTAPVTYTTYAQMANALSYILP